MPDSSEHVPVMVTGAVPQQVRSRLAEP